MNIFNLNFDRELHIHGLCDWCGLPKGAGHVCPVDEDPRDDDVPAELQEDELLLDDGEGA